MPVLATVEGEVAPRSRDRPEAGQAAQNNGPKDIITFPDECECAIFFGEENAQKRRRIIEESRVLVDREQRQNSEYAAAGDKRSCRISETVNTIFVATYSISMGWWRPHTTIQV